MGARNSKVQVLAVVTAIQRRGSRAIPPNDA